MTQNDVIYRYFNELAANLGESRLNVTFCSGLEKSAHKDEIVVMHNLCHVDETWLKAIERGIEFIGKAIEEDRQFIRSDGEVKPIEKVKHVSRESVQHLSRHSDLISKENRDKGDVVPDKLYTVERLSDYAVYENRFLYTLIMFIRDFVSVRYEGILRAYKSYRGELTVNKKYVTATGRFVYSVAMTDERDDVFPNAADPQCTAHLQRMERIEQSIDFFLRTPLMTEVAKVDKIKGKLTKTNVLRMDKNFRECVTLYEFLRAYEGDGYTIEPIVTRLDPVSEQIGRELAVPALLASFLTFEHGLGIEETMKEEFDKEEIRREERRQAALVEEINDLKRRVAETGTGMEEYMLKLEERNAALEKEKSALVGENTRLGKELEDAQNEIKRLNDAIEELNSTIESLNNDIATLEADKERLIEEKRLADEEHRREIEELRREMQEAEERHASELRAAVEAEREITKNVRAECDEKLREADARFAEKCRELDEKLAEKRMELDAKQAEVTGAKRETGDMAAQCEMLRARITALRKEGGLLTSADDFTTEEGFGALEHDFEVLGRLVRDEWEGIKKTLKKEFMADIKATVHAKKARKSGEYVRMRDAELKRRAVQAEAQASAEERDAGKADEEPPAEATPDDAPTSEATQADVEDTVAADVTADGAGVGSDETAGPDTASEVARKKLARKKRSKPRA